MTKKKEKEIEVPSAIIKIRPDGILHIDIRIKGDYDLGNSLEIFDARMKLTGEKSYPHLYTGSLYLSPEEKVREFAASEKRNRHVIADAFVISSLSQRLVGNFYINFNKPKRPTRLFTDIDKAIEWLKSFI